MKPCPINVKVVRDNEFGGLLKSNLIHQKSLFNVPPQDKIKGRVEIKVMRDGADKTVCLKIPAEHTICLPVNTGARPPLLCVCGHACECVCVCVCACV